MDHFSKSWTKKLIHEESLNGMKIFSKKGTFFEIMNKF
jgi:hypothetical protein